jgi:hypothetical protein
MHNDRPNNLVMLSDWPSIPRHAPIGTPDAIVESNLGEVVRGVLDKMRQDGRIDRSERLAHLRNFRSKTYRLTDDLAISIEETAEGFIARSYDTGQYGWGISPDDAIANLCGVLEDYYEILQEERDSLSAALEAHLSYLASVLAKI